MNEDYSQPFCIVGSKGRFHPSYRFYLPPLERREEAKEEIEPKEVIHRHYNYTSDLSRKQWDEIEQLKRTVSYLLKEKDKQPIKKKDRYIKYIS